MDVFNFLFRPRSWKLGRIRKILDRHGPRSRDEYFFLYPEACPACGGRQVTAYITWFEKYEVGSISTGGAMYSSVNHRWLLCDRCGHKYQEGKDFWFNLAQQHPEEYPLKHNKFSKDAIIDIGGWRGAEDIYDQLRSLPERIPEQR